MGDENINMEVAFRWCTCAAALMLVGVASATTTINVGMLMRLTNDGVDLGNSWKSVAAASLLAVKHFNTRNSSLIPAFGQLSSCDVQLAVSPTVHDSRSTSSRAAQLVVEGYNNWHAIIGPARSATTVTAATIGAFLKIPQIGYWSSSPTLDNVEHFPYFGRVCPSDLATNKARIAYFKKVGWNRIGLLYINDAWGAPIASDLAASFSALPGWTLKTQAFTGGSVEEMRTGLTTLKNDNYKIFLYMSYRADTLLMLSEAVKLGMVGKDYAWTLADIDMVESLNGAEFDEEINNAIKGSTAIFPAAVEGTTGVGSPGWTAMVDGWNSLNVADFNNLMPATSQLSSDFFTAVPSTLSDTSAFSFDAVAALGLAGCAAASTDPDALFTAYKAVDFAGLSGQVRMNSETGTRALGTTNIKIRNLQPGSTNEYTDVAYYNATSDSLTFVRDVIYWDGTSEAPPAVWPVENFWESTTGIALLVVLPLLLIGGVMVGTFYYQAFHKKQKKIEEDHARNESVMRGISLSYLLQSLEVDATNEVDESLEMDAHNSVEFLIKSGMLSKYNEEFADVREAVAAVKAARAKVTVAEEKCATLGLEKDDFVQIQKKGHHYGKTVQVLEPNIVPGMASVSIADQIKSYMHMDLLKLADVPHFEALAKAEAAVTASEAEKKRLCQEKNYVEKNSRGNYDPNFYQIKYIMAGCPEDHCEHAPGECPGDHALGKGTRCPRDLKLDCSIADHFYDKQTNHGFTKSRRKEVCAGTSTRFLSWTWSYKVSTMQNGIEAWRRTSDSLRSAHEFFWICFFCNNQFRPSITADTFKERVKQIGHIIAILDKWKDPEYLKRKWCIYEVFEEQTLHQEQRAQNQAARDAAVRKFIEAEKAVKEFDCIVDDAAHAALSLSSAALDLSTLVESKYGETNGANLRAELEVARGKKMSAIQKIDGETTMKLTFTLPEEEAQGLRKQLEKPNEKGFQEVVDFLFKIDVAGAKCGNPKDEEMIDNLIEKNSNTKEVNKTVRQRLLKWVARVATSDKTGEVEELIHRHTVNWYRDNQQLEDCWEAEEFVPSLSRVMTTFNTVANCLANPKQQVGIPRTRILRRWSIQ